MEDNSSLFSISIDAASREHLSESARWARFLAIVGFIFLGILILSGFAMSATVSRLDDAYGSNTRGFGAVAGITTIVTYIVVAVIYFFPLLYLLRFSNATREALASNDQDRLTTAFQNLRATFKYVGVITIIALVFMFIALIMVFAGVALSS